MQYNRGSEKVKLPVSKSIIIEAKDKTPEISFQDAIVLTINHEKPNSISVDEIRRDLIETIGLKPIGCEKKVYVIPDAQLMTVQAQNTLLKTLEEPPEYAQIILITNNAESLLETIRSRCITVYVNAEEQRGYEEYFGYFDELGNLDSVRANEIALELLPNAKEVPDAARAWLLKNGRERFDIGKALAAIDKAENRIKFNVNSELTLEMMLLEIQEK